MYYLFSITDIDQTITLALNGSKSLFWDNLMMIITNTFSWSLLIVVLLYILFKNNSVRDAFVILFVIGLMIFVADRLCSGLIKPTIARWRPTQDPYLMYIVDTVNNYRGGRYGFFSGHACNTMCVAIFLTFIFMDRKLSCVLLFWSITTTFTRLYLGVHYFGDIIVGWLTGAAIGYIFYKLYYNIFNIDNKYHRESSEYTKSGYKKNDINFFITTIFFNYLLLILISLTKGI